MRMRYVKLIVEVAVNENTSDEAAAEEVAKLIHKATQDGNRSMTTFEMDLELEDVEVFER